jgi:transcriptional regulator NrdR family protein
VSPRNKPKPLACPYCRGQRSKVVDTRDAPHTVKERLAWVDRGLWRRRQCQSCFRTFDTEETVLPPDHLQHVGLDGSRIPHT